MRKSVLVAGAACLLSAAPALANTIAYAPAASSAIQAFAPESAFAPRLAAFAPTFGTADDPSGFRDDPIVFSVAAAPQELSEPSSAGLLFFGAGLIGLCYVFDALVRSRKKA